jgi:hypothetical protein
MPLRRWSEIQLSSRSLCLAEGPVVRRRIHRVPIIRVAVAGKEWMRVYQTRLQNRIETTEVKKWYQRTAAIARLKEPQQMGAKERRRWGETEVKSVKGVTPAKERGKDEAE